MKVKVTLSIGYPTASHEDIIDVDDDDYASCKNDDQRGELIYEYWQEWANNYIDAGWVILPEPTRKKGLRND